jgi:hypothetical protein
MKSQSEEKASMPQLLILLFLISIAMFLLGSKFANPEDVLKIVFAADLILGTIWLLVWSRLIAR